MIACGRRATAFAVRAPFVAAVHLDLIKGGALSTISDMTFTINLINFLRWPARDQE